VTQTHIDLVDVLSLSHIEGFSDKRVKWLTNKIIAEGSWNKPIVVEDEHLLVMDGQHRMEAALRMGLARVPAVRYRYDEVEVWSLRSNHEVTPQLVVARALAGDIYPYKTVKHSFPEPIPACAVPIAQLA
jgi:hypothetical protein